MAFPDASAVSVYDGASPVLGLFTSSYSFTVAPAEAAPVKPSVTVISTVEVSGGFYHMMKTITMLPHSQIKVKMYIS